VHDIDLQRYPPWGRAVDWIVAAGFAAIGWQPVERYAQGLHRIRVAVEEGNRKGEIPVFRVRIPIDMLTGRV